jgi:hypothetical protein
LLRRLTNALNIDVPRLASDPSPRARRRARRRRAFVVVAVSRRLFRLFRGRERREISIAEIGRRDES